MGSRSKVVRQKKGGVLTSLNSWQVTIESSVSLRSHYKTSTLKNWLSSFPWSSVWAAGVSAPVVTANATWQEQEAQESLTCFWRFSKMNQLLCIFLPKYSARNKNFAHPISQTWQLWQFYCSVLLKHSHRFTWLNPGLLLLPCIYTCHSLQRVMVIPYPLHQGESGGQGWHHPPVPVNIL